MGWRRQFLMRERWEIGVQWEGRCQPDGEIITNQRPDTIAAAAWHLVTWLTRPLMHQTTGLTCLSTLFQTQNIRVSGSCRQWTRDCPVSGGWRCHNSLCPTIGDSIASPIITPLAAPLARICRDTGDTAANIAQLSPGRMRYHLDTTIFQALIIIDQVWRSRYNV